MSHWREMFDQPYLGAWDMGETIKPNTPYTITKVDPGEVFNKESNKNVSKAIIHFEGLPKPMVGNITNCQRLEALFGKDHHEWPGGAVIIRTEQVNTKDGPIESLRIKPERVQAQAKPAPAKPKKSPSGQLWELMAEIHGRPDKKDAEAMKFAMVQCNEWLWDQGWMNPDGETLEEIDDARKQQIIEQIVGAE